MMTGLTGRGHHSLPHGEQKKIHSMHKAARKVTDATRLMSNVRRNRDMAMEKRMLGVSPQMADRLYEGEFGGGTDAEDRKLWHIETEQR